MTFLMTNSNFYIINSKNPSSMFSPIFFFDGQYPSKYKQHSFFI